MHKKRKSPRREVDLEVRMSCHVGQSQIVHTRDISDGGMYLIMENSHKIPEIGEVLELTLIGESANKETLPESAAVVVHIETTGIGVAYVKMELDEDF